MMHVFRLCKPKFADLDGEGAKLYGGRWNFRGYKVVYTSCQLSLAVLELLVHTAADLIPEGLISIEIEIPTQVTHEQMSFPSAWQNTKDSNILKQIGTQWLQEQRSAVLIVPSVIVPSENNVLINPLHPDSSHIRIIQQQDFHLDQRLI